MIQYIVVSNACVDGDKLWLWTSGISPATIPLLNNSPIKSRGNDSIVVEMPDRTTTYVLPRGMGKEIAKVMKAHERKSKKR